jgi:hypothetical protein
VLNEKKSKRRGHDYSETKELYPKNKKSKVDEIDPLHLNESVFHRFKIDNSLVWYRGDVVSMISVKDKLLYDVLFDDGAKVKKMTRGVLKKAIPNKEEIQYIGNKK